jgi:putative colanic acid biosysnthesis UDP-glucose lipid carrier transferase
LSTHQHSTVFVRSADSIGEAIAALPSPIDFLPDGSASLFAPVNTNDDWAVGFGKRLMDIMVAVPALLVLSPLFLFIALLITIDSNGPVFFRQTRTGACGKSFEILKFRTMYVMEEGAEVKQAVAGDPRTTRIGRFLRKYSLDELPQLLNVANGDMALVGPRPHAQAHDTYYGERIADYGHRFAVKPGMTGWAQINGHRGPTPTIDVMAARIDHDVWYVKHASFALDLKILLKTPLAVISPRNAF